MASRAVDSSGDEVTETPSPPSREELLAETKRLVDSMSVVITQQELAAEDRLRTKRNGSVSRDEVPPVGELEHPPPERKEFLDFVEPFPAFVERIKQLPKPKYLIGDLVVEGTTGLIAGHPRTRKSLMALELALCAATGEVPFGLPRLAVPEPFPVMLISNEDSAHMTMERALMLLEGRGIGRLPENFFVSVRRGVDLDDEDWQAATIDRAKKYGVKMTIPDPLRSLTSCVDKGPADLKPFVTFIRQFINETGSALVSVHHDVKPPAGKPDDRSRPQRASGGGIFSVSDAPIHLELAGKKTLVVPEAFKFSEDPEPFTFDVVVTDGAMGLIGQTTTLADAIELELAGKLLDYLGEHPGSSTTQVQKAVGRRKDAVRATLEKLLEQGKVDSAKGARNADLWFPAEGGTR